MSDAPQTRTDSLTPSPNGRTSEVEALTAALAEARWQQAVLASLIAQVPVGVFVADAKTGLPQLVNQAGIDLLGRGLDPQRRPDESAELYPNYLPGTQQLYPVQDLPMVRTMSTGEPARAEIDVQRPAGRVRVEMTTTPVCDAAGRVVSAVAVIQPVIQPPTDLGASPQAEGIFQQAIEAAGAVPYRRDHLTNQYTYLGDGIQAITGYRPEEMTSQLFESLVDERVLAGNARWSAGDGNKAGQPVGTGPLQVWRKRSDLRLHTRDGQTRWVADSSIEIMDDRGNAIGLVGILQDITERKQTEAALAQRAAELEEATSFLDSVIENLPTMLFVKEAQALRFVRWNKAGEDLLGFSRQAMIGKNDYDFFPKEEADFFTAKDREVLAADQLVDIPEEPIQTAHRGLRLLHTRKIPLRDAHGQPKYLLGISEDITERKQADTALGKRATELEVVAQVGTATATILDPNQLLQTVVDLTKGSFKLYHVHVYLLNELGDTLELAAGAGEVGHKMVSQGWRIPFNREQSLVARAARSRQGLIVNDVREAPDFLPNPLLPDTRSEMALPIIANDRLLGVLDVQGDEINHFTVEDLRIQGILATQIAVALQNARQFAEARRLADQETLVNAISQQIQNATTVESALQIAARELGRALGAQRTIVQLSQYSAPTGDKP